MKTIPTLLVLALLSTTIFSCTKVMPVIHKVKPSAHKPIVPPAAEPAEDSVEVVDSLPLFLGVTSMYTLDQVLSISIDGVEVFKVSSDTGEVMFSNKALANVAAGQVVKVTLNAGTGNMQLQVRKNDFFEADILHNLYLYPGEEKSQVFTIDPAFGKYSIFILCQV